MVHNQLFRKMPDKILIDNLLKAFNLDNLDDDKPFSRLELNTHDTISKLNNLKSLLKTYYIPCKARAYLSDLNDKNIITILRQCIKTFGFKLYSKEKYLQNEKYLYYTIRPIDTTVERDVKQCAENKCVVTFS
jgi:hypothetical protein